MASSDDEADVGPQSVSNYYFVDDEDAPTSFSVLPLQWSKSESVNEKKKQQMFLHGSVDNGLQTIHKEVTAWKFDLLNEIPDISVLTKENNWIKLEKPRKSFEEIIRTVLITVHCLHFARRNPEASGKSVWDHLCKVFSLYDVRPSLNDLVDHMALISEAVRRDDWLAKSKFLLAFLEEKPRKRKLSDEDVKATTVSAFIVDNVDDDILEDAVEDESDEVDELFDSVCAICDNGGALLCCEGSCMRSFHPTRLDGEESNCDTLGFTRREVDAIERFLCKNCEYNQHQCFACGELGYSNKSSGAEVFRCANATCGHFYHSHCIAKLLHQEDEVAVGELEKKVATGESFTCPIHKCYICKKGENKKIKELQFAVCRRCPTSYHRKCLPKEIVFEKKEEEEEEEEEEGKGGGGGGEEEEEETAAARAWEGLLPNRVLIYCLKHEIIDDLGTPSRDIRFPNVEEKKKKRILELPGSSGKLLPKKRRLTSEDSFSAKTVAKELNGSYSGVTKIASIKRSEKISSGSDLLRKVKTNDAFRKSLKENTKSCSTDVDRSATTTINKTSLGDRLYRVMTKRSEQVKLQKQVLHSSELNKTMTVKTSARKLSNELPSLDAETEKRILALIKEAASSITMDDVKKKHKVPSTHAYSSKTVVDKTITTGKVEGAVEAVRTALRKLEDGCSTEDAKAVCEPEVLNQVFKWKIVNVLHWYVQDGDMVVDFCCGANDFSCLMKKKLEETGKKCSYKNYDVFQPKNDFNFEKRDWMTVQPDELPKRGSQLIMGLNPPFGVKAALANKFIDKALEFKPKLLILIVPPETERLDKKRTPYDLVWEDDQFLSGKSFYLPGSVDENDKQMEQWNVTAPLLYLWSRPDWSVKHKAIAQKHDHLFMRRGGSNLEKSCHDSKSPDHPVEVHCCNPGTSEVTDDLYMESKEPNHEIALIGGRKECSPHENGDKESQDSHGLERNRSEETSRKTKHIEDKIGRGTGEKLPKNKWKGGKPSGSDTNKEVPHRSPTNVVDGRTSQEGPPSRSLETPMHTKVGENSLPNLESGMPSSHLPYGTAYGGSMSYVHEDVGSKYSMNGMEYSHGIHGFPHANLEEQSTGNMREIAEDIGYRSYVTGLERGSDMRSQVRFYGQDVDYSVQRNYLGGLEPGYGQMGPLSSIPYGHVGAAVESSYRMNMPAMQRYAPRLDELNHTRMNNFGSDPSMLNRNNIIYDSRAPRPGPPGGHVDSMGFAPGPQYPYPHSSAGWLNE
ncbi:protein ENHANCED DOWNY MILDEW 2 isoform X2 [Hevea brasiliensis]|uniref:protein ENHANCED DOWNY MILDEW 2 isoform X2 n=1 Tax=Hevea brasiliensis TaxID=3981 RepID=UPI0025FD8372|nr:protein ENHANCED DOWNY MILDEW 2 isoform X2 [Hevea brasiliensis]